MSLQNRVLPNGEIVAESWRGLLMGNRGGKIHDPETRMLTKRRWASRRWISCVTEFKNRQRVVMGDSYTELFFTDEAAALASGHRPCFECRRNAANSFADLWRDVFALSHSRIADAMDKQLQVERIGEKETITPDEIGTLPDGAMISHGNLFYALGKGKCWQWSGQGYKAANQPNKPVKLL
ncbi:MAG: hypothetical protein AAF217_15695, partial [Pseudomonadota bacterium]